MSKNREFFVMSPGDAYELLESIAIISGSQDKLKRLKQSGKKDSKTKRPPINFKQCGLKDGDELVYIEDESVRVIIQGEHKVLYDDELTSLSAIVQNIKGISSVAGPSYFTFNGELLTDIANRTQWKTD